VSEKHIFRSSGFDDVFFTYIQKLLDFERYFVSEILVESNAWDLQPNSTGENIYYSENYNSHFYENFFTELLRSKPLININHYNDDASHNSYKIYYLNNDEDLEGFYSTEGFEDFDFAEASFVKIYKLKDVNLLSINNFWLE
jgi:hypothetical protein